jgi:hypothetical protein
MRKIEIICDWCGEKPEEEHIVTSRYIMDIDCAVELDFCNEGCLIAHYTIGLGRREYVPGGGLIF